MPMHHDASFLINAENRKDMMLRRQIDDARLTILSACLYSHILLDSKSINHAGHEKISDQQILHFYLSWLIIIIPSNIEQKYQRKKNQEIFFKYILLQR